MFKVGEVIEGTIVRLNRGFGFISIPDNEEDFFFHKDDLMNNQVFDALRPKMIVEFIPVEDTRKPGKIRASEVTVMKNKGPHFGVIKTLNNGFGFLSVAGEDTDYFFHNRDLPKRIRFEDLQEGMEMSFVPIEGKGGKPAASEIEILPDVVYGRRDGRDGGGRGGGNPYGRQGGFRGGQAQRYNPYEMQPRSNPYAQGGYGAPPPSYGAPPSAYAPPAYGAPQAYAQRSYAPARPYAPPAQAYAPAQAATGFGAGQRRW